MKNPEPDDVGLWDLLVKGAAWRACEYDVVSTVIEKRTGSMRAQWRSIWEHGVKRHFRTNFFLKTTFQSFWVKVDQLIIRRYTCDWLQTHAFSSSPCPATASVGPGLSPPRAVGLGHWLGQWTVCSSDSGPVTSLVFRCLNCLLSPLLYFCHHRGENM